MPKTLHLQPADVAGFSSLANDATVGVTGVVEDVHRKVASRASILAPPPVRGITAGITGLVYDSIRAVSRLVDMGIRLAPLPPAERKGRVSPRREAVVAALNGVLGDYLIKTNNPLAISMSLRHKGRPLEIEREALEAAFAQPTGKVLLLAHGLCLSDVQWKRKGHDHGAALAREFGYTPVYLHYNSGLHVSENGRAFADLIEEFLEQWPVEVKELAILGHSMGGLVSRSAHYYGSAAGHRWTQYLRRLVFLGAPHHGSPVERLGNWVDTALEASPYTVPYARLGKIRSAGITDMRHGNLLAEDWEGRDRFAPEGDVRRPLPLPAGVQCYAIAATRRQIAENPRLDLLGDGLVQVDSALGHHANPEMCLGLDGSHEWIGYGMNHWDLLSHPAVYERIRGWFALQS